MQFLQFCMIFVANILKKKKKNFFVSVSVPSNHIFSNEVVKIQSFAPTNYIDKDSCGISLLTCVPVVG